MRLPNSKKTDFSRAYLKANEILVKSSEIQTFPFLPKDESQIKHIFRDKPGHLKDTL
mgnify:CR=1 FL=1|jgi:hypothetical protein